MNKIIREEENTLFDVFLKILFLPGRIKAHFAARAAAEIKEKRLRSYPWAVFSSLLLFLLNA
jgi:hypothetical protein